MINVTKLLAGLIFAFGLVATSNAGSMISSSEGFKVYQSDTAEEEEEEKKKKEGEEEEPDC